MDKTTGRQLIARLKKNPDISRAHHRYFYIRKKSLRSRCGRAESFPGPWTAQLSGAYPMRSHRILGPEIPQTSIAVYRIPGLWRNVWTDTLTIPISFNLRVRLWGDNPSSFLRLRASLRTSLEYDGRKPFSDLKVFARSNSFPLVSWVA